MNRIALGLAAALLSPTAFAQKSSIFTTNTSGGSPQSSGASTPMLHKQNGGSTKADTSGAAGTEQRSSTQGANQTSQTSGQNSSQTSGQTSRTSSSTESGTRTHVSGGASVG